MSAGKFTESFYEADSGNIYNIKVQPETITTDNPAATGPADQETSANAVNRRGNGMFARMVSLKWVGDPPVAPAGYDPNGRLRVPILTPTAYQALSVGDSFNYLGVAARVTGLIPERRR